MSQMRWKMIFVAVMATLSFNVWAASNENATSVFANDNLEKISGSSQVPAPASAFSSTTTGVAKTQAVAINPVPPVLNVHGYALEDVHSGKMLASQNLDQKMAPASLTKLMTLYVTFAALEAGRIHMTDLVPISQNAWRTGGSRMFVKVNDKVSVSDLIDGVIVDSGNDACVALAEFIGGTEENFVSLMNAQAKLLSMKNTHYIDCTGLPNPDHYTTPQDMTTLASAIILNFPKYYPLFSQKTFTYNKITQPNRNRLLWRDAQVDGLKTGHTDEAGFCLIASAKHGDMRLLSVLLGAPSDATRAEYTENLLNYGFRFYETHKIYTQNQVIERVPVYFGKSKLLSIGVVNDFYLTTLSGQYPQVKIKMQMQSPLKAPIKQGQKVGEVLAEINGKTIAQVDLVALETVAKGGIFSRSWDHLRVMMGKGKS